MQHEWTPEELVGTWTLVEEDWGGSPTSMVLPAWVSL